MSTHRLLLSNARQLVQVVNQGERCLTTAEQYQRIVVLEQASLLIDHHGAIAAVGTATEVQELMERHHWTAEVVKDVTGKVLLPGFVDAHTHPVWAGDRSHEFKLKLAGASYLEVQKAGGGIGFTTRCTREATEESLLRDLLQRMDRMLRCGTTTMEGKSGYGLEVESERKMLRVLKQGHDRHPIDVVSTFCGAHAVPAGSTSTEAVRHVVDVMLPAVMQDKAEGRNNVTSIDVFCETGVFNREESREILVAGKAAGLAINFHGDELTPTQSGELAGELGARAVAHLEHVTDEGIVAMARAGTFAVLLPATAYVLRIAPPPARKLIAGSVAIALGSDFCPNAHVLSMPHTMNLACVLMHMTVEEALVASTLNAAASLGISEQVGSLEVGKRGDVVVLGAEKWEHIVYQMVDPPIDCVVKNGVIVVEQGQLIKRQ